jgi:hypothetical protein
LSLLAYTEFANAICHKLQKAAQAMVQARITANSLEVEIPLANVFGGIGRLGLTSTRVVCLSQNAVPSEMWEGNWMADLDVGVIAPFSDIDEDDFHSLSGQVFAFFFQAPETVCARLSNADVKFTAQAIYPRGQSWELVRDDDERLATPVAWQSTIKFQVHCSGSVIE